MCGQQLVAAWLRSGCVLAALWLLSGWSLFAVALVLIRLLFAVAYVVEYGAEYVMGSLVRYLASRRLLASCVRDAF
jgi:hypothetical protein